MESAIGRCSCSRLSAARDDWEVGSWKLPSHDFRFLIGSFLALHLHRQCLISLSTLHPVQHDSVHMCSEVIFTWAADCLTCKDRNRASNPCQFSATQVSLKLRSRLLKCEFCNSASSTQTEISFCSQRPIFTSPHLGRESFAPRFAIAPSCLVLFENSLGFPRGVIGCFMVRGSLIIVLPGGMKPFNVELNQGANSSWLRIVHTRHYFLSVMYFSIGHLRSFEKLSCQHRCLQHSLHLLLFYPP
jgi:hypothetical protein